VTSGVAFCSFGGIGVARGCIPRAEKIFCLGQIYREMLKVHPQAESAPPRFFEEIGEIWTVGEVI